MLLKDLPSEARPREKLLSLGASALADAELLALLLRTGFKGTSVLLLAEQLLLEFGGMAGLLQAQAEDLRRIKGLGPAKRAELVAVLELARRALAQKLKRQPAFTSPQQFKDYLRLSIGGYPYEVFAVAFLDSQNRMIAFEEMFRGSLTQTSVHPREVLRRAMHHNAAAVLLAHNHPSGVAEPSKADEYVTRTMKAALAVMEVRVLDHMVVGADEVVSFAERGLL